MIDRTSAWQALHDPATTASQLAEIAGEHPEFAAAVARHQNAYPALVAWARGRAGAGATGGATDARRFTWLIAAVAYLVVEMLTSFIPLQLPGIAGALYYDWSLLIFAGAAAVSAREAARRTIGILCGVGAFVMFFVSSCLSIGAFSGGVVVQGTPWYFAVLTAVGSGLVFIAWGITKPLSGLAYLGLLPAIGLELLAGFVVLPPLWGLLSGTLHLPFSIAAVINSAAYVAADAVAIAVTAVVTLSLDRPSRREAVSRSGWAG